MYLPAELDFNLYSYKHYKNKHYIEMIEKMVSQTLKDVELDSETIPI